MRVNYHLKNPPPFYAIRLITKSALTDKGVPRYHKGYR